MQVYKQMPEAQMAGFTLSATELNEVHTQTLIAGLMQNTPKLRCRSTRNTLSVFFQRSQGRLAHHAQSESYKLRLKVYAVECIRQAQMAGLQHSPSIQ